MIWSYGVITVPARSALLEASIASLAAAGFPSPRLFMDDGLRVVGNTIKALVELYLRSPVADRYALFQDDILAVANLRTYLERCRYPIDGYLNLILYPDNEADLAEKRQGWQSAAHKGRGAQGLVFSREALMTLLQQQSFWYKPQDLQRGWHNVDGCIVVAMRNAGWREFIHYPSLLDHTGAGKTTFNPVAQPPITSFPGEAFDALSLLDKNAPTFAPATFQEQPCQSTVKTVRLGR